MGKFTQEDVKNLQGFLQFVADKAEFKLDMSDAMQLAKYRMFGSELLKKINDHILELQSVTEEPKPKRATKSKPKTDEETK
jgi:hypothetical protein